MKKVLCLIDNLGSGGAQRQLVNLAILLKQAGYAVDFAVYRENDFYQPLLDAENIKVHTIKENNPLKLILKMRSYIRRINPDVVIPFLETPGFLACIAKFGDSRWKLITNELSAKLSTFTDRKNRFYNWFERFSDVKVCNSQNAVQMWNHYYPQYHDKYRVIYNPVLIQNQPNVSHLYRKDGKLHLVVAASYQELKNPLGLIEAILLLDETEKEKIVIDWYGRVEVTIGNTVIYECAVQMIKANALDSTIRLHHETKKIYDIMSQADVIGLFSTVEGLPNVICEAMMFGKPVIMSKVSDYQILTEGNGITCDPTPEGIALGLRELLQLPPSDLDKMGKLSYEKANRLFSPEAIVKQWIEVIED